MTKRQPVKNTSRPIPLEAQGQKFWPNLKGEVRQAGISFYFPLIAIVAFSLIFWILQFFHHSEPLILTNIYRYFDYNYFPFITRVFTHGIGEGFFVDSLGKGVSQWPLAGLLPY